MNTSVTEHLISQATKAVGEQWGPTAKIAFIAGPLCQWWVCLDGKRLGCGEWRPVPSLLLREAEAEGPVT